jgi:hypothetical protein
MSETTVQMRPRRRGVTPVRGALAAVLLVAAGFTGGVLVQKHAGGSGGATQNAAARFQARASGSQQGGAASGATTGDVASVHGRTLYVTSSDGTTVKVSTNANTKVTRMAVSKVRAVHPGDSVVVQGAAASNGTVKATRVTATASNASGGLLGGFGGAGPPTGGGG